MATLRRKHGFWRATMIEFRESPVLIQLATVILLVAGLGGLWGIPGASVVAGTMVPGLSADNFGPVLCPSQ